MATFTELPIAVVGSRPIKYASNRALTERIQDELLASLNPSLGISNNEAVRHTRHNMFDQLLLQENIILSWAEREQLFENIAAEILGFGPL